MQSGPHGCRHVCMRCTPRSPRCRRSTPTQCSLRGPRFPQSYGGCDFRMQSLPFGAKKKLLDHVLADPCLDNARLYCSLQPLKTCCHCLSRQAKGIDRMSAYKSPKQDAVVMGFSDCKHTEDIVLSRTDTTDALWVFTLVIVLVLHTLSVIGRNRTDSQGMPMASLLVVIGGAMGSMLATSRKPFGIGSLFPGGNRPTRCHAHSSDVAAGGRCSDSGSVVTGADRGVTVSGVARPRRRGQRCSVDAISVIARFLLVCFSGEFDAWSSAIPKSTNKRIATFGLPTSCSTVRRVWLGSRCQRSRSERTVANSSQTRCAR